MQPASVSRKELVEPACLSFLSSERSVVPCVACIVDCSNTLRDPPRGASGLPLSHHPCHAGEAGLAKVALLRPAIVVSGRDLGAKTCDLIPYTPCHAPRPLHPAPEGPQRRRLWKEVGEASGLKHPKAPSVRNMFRDGGTTEGRVRSTSGAAGGRGGGSGGRGRRAWPALDSTLSFVLSYVFFVLSVVFCFFSLSVSTSSGGLGKAKGQPYYDDGAQLNRIVQRITYTRRGVIIHTSNRATSTHTKASIF